MNSIFKRKSIRKFERIKVEEEKIRLLLTAAMSAPTACNQQEWEYVVVTEPEILQLLGKTSPNAGPVKNAPFAIVPLINYSLAGHPKYCE